MMNKLCSRPTSSAVTCKFGGLVTEKHPDFLNSFTITLYRFYDPWHS
uniref:Uncharacterized protein n=1 Tax=Arundo donax TaxID=35708 RepID=A0A0A9HNF2_ARUDO